MNVFQIECFLAVAQNLNFARAAEQLHVTQPAITQQIHSLEKELNVKLFIRTTRMVKLTEEGKTFLSDAHQMLAISQRAKKRFENSSNVDFQVLSIGCYSFPTLFLLTDALKQLAKSHPTFHPHLQVIPFLHIFRLLEEEDLDIIISFKEPKNKKIKATYQELCRFPLVCVCPANHRLSTRQSLKLEELQDERLILFTPQQTSPFLAQLQGQLMGGRSPSEFYFCESAEAITVLVNAGFGVSILPDLFVPDSAPITKVPIEGLETVSFGVYYKTLQGNDLLRDFIAELKASLK